MSAFLLAETRPRSARAALWAAATLALLALSTGCDIQSSTASTATLTYTEDARAAYNEAMDAYRGKEWENARALFSEVRRLFAYSRYARLAELRLADVEFEQEKFAESVALYREFIQNHRTDSDVEYAKYRIAKALFLDIDDTIVLPPAEERDQATTFEAFKELRGFLRDFPRSRYKVDASYMFDVVLQRLVRHELYIARYYLKIDVFDATIARIDYVLKTYPKSGLDAEALVLKGETLLKMKKRNEAREVFQQVVAEHGDPFASVAKRFLAELGAPSAAPAAKSVVKPEVKPEVKPAAEPTTGAEGSASPSEQGP